ncbi:RNA polymerase sigma factor [Terriglobus albidus]|uniref:RNA polymerase sigma factor n=1 Tax=Terriglobus albidus TaxID=1592106 RepID=A0A5B9ECA9_9BACT|nr:RNA polymerase sigma factor [Terriglobus albidus]QEE29833.1 RNA polymerase sigma factor [Terriglobus albidus]
MFKRYRVSRDRESDAALVRAACLGNGDAIAELYQRHGAIVYRFTLRMCSDASMAEEITQEAFLAFLRHPHHFEAERSAFSTWLCGVARRQLWKRLERGERFVELDDVEEPIEAPSSDAPDQWLSRKEAVEMVRKGIEELPLLLKEVVILCELEEMTYPQASLILAVPVGTVRSRLHRAKARLATLLSAVPACAEKGIRP